MWRPNDWPDYQYKYSKYPPLRLEQNAFEAGANAMLEALRKRAMCSLPPYTRVDYDRELVKEADRSMTITKVSCKMVLIPDEEG